MKTKTKLTASKRYYLPDYGWWKAPGDSWQLTWTGYSNMSLFFVEVCEPDFSGHYTFPSSVWWKGVEYVVIETSLLSGLLLASACAAEQVISSPEFLFVVCRG